MRPFLRFAFYSKRWYVDTGRRDYRTYPGTAWTGYDTYGEAYAAAIAARIAEPA